MLSDDIISAHSSEKSSNSNEVNFNQVYIHNDKIESIKNSKTYRKSNSGIVNSESVYFERSEKSEKSEKSQQTSVNFECTIKLIDQYINSIQYPDPTEFNNNIKTLIIKSNYKEQIPFIHTIGDIIRVQHSYCKQKVNKCLYLNFSHNFNKKNGIQNWCIFSGLTPQDSKNFN